MASTSTTDNLPGGGKWELDTESPDSGFDYDLIVIGGGSGGIACAKEAASLGAKVAVLDYVEASPQGTTWGLGGTCLNVGCIPKKLMHTTALYGEVLRDAHEYGWGEKADGFTTPDEVGLPGKHNWETLKNIVNDYIGGVNFAYEKGFRQDASVDYFNGLGTMVDAHTVHVFNDTKVRRKQVDKNITGRRVVIAVGGRPRYPDIPGAKELCITSDDIFQLDHPPGKTLLVGASYVALECGGFLHGLGYDTTVMVRSILLRGYDQEVAEKIGDYMKEIGVKFIRPATPTSFERHDDGKRIVVKYELRESGEVKSVQETYDTVVLAIGRNLKTTTMNLDKAGVKLERGGYIKTNHERTNVPHIFAIGDVVANGPQLTPVAIQAGQLLAKRLFALSDRTMDYHLVPTTVFTPIEYGTIGLTEKQAIDKLGEDNVEVYHAYFQPLSWNPLQFNHRPKNSCFIKLVCDLSDKERVIGFHYLGEHAGEITQGYATAMRLGATKKDFDETVGIHPTSAEQLHKVTVTKRSGDDPVGDGACST
mmetsp:Transcript_13224/g.19936  ORF Transcript_13224/g.19936 Transcript_13224/m.19936 type:complete len:535 (+) Transcript_13224:57-1661(+)